MATVYTDRAYSTFFMEDGKGTSPYVVYDDRASAEAAAPFSFAAIIGVVSPSGHVLTYKRDNAGTALITGDGQKWSPSGKVYPDHFAENTTPGVTDLSGAINAAFAFSRVVKCRPGKIGIGSKVTVPAGHSLVSANGSGGILIDNDGSEINEGGTIFCVNFGAGITYADPAEYFENAAFEISSGATFQGASFWYPSQNVAASSPSAAYPPALAVAADARNTSIEDVNLGNSYIGIDARRTNADLTLRNVRGFPLYRGFIHGSSVNPANVTNVHFSALHVLRGEPWISPNIASWVMNPANGAAAAELARTTWSEYHIWAFGYARGAYLTNHAEDTANGITIGGSPQNIKIKGGFDTCPICIEGDGYQGRITLDGVNFAPRADYAFAVPETWAVKCVNPGGVVTDMNIINCNVWSADEGVFYLENQDGSFIAHNNIYAVGEEGQGTAVHLENCPNSQVVHNDIDCNGNANGCIGVDLVGNCSGTQVSGNNIRNFDSFPIRTVQSDNLHVQDNQGSGNTLTLYTDAAATKKYQNITTGNRDDKSNSYGNGDVSATILQVNRINEFITYSGTGGISGLPHGYVGQRLTIRFTAACTVTDEAGALSQENRLYMAGNFVTTFGDILRLESAGALGWYETSRSAN